MGVRGAAFSIATTVAACSLTTDLSGFASNAVSGDAAASDDARTDRPIVVDPSDAYGAAVAVDTPAAWFRFEESAGEPARDSVTTLTGTYASVGVDYGVPGISGRAVRLDGLNGRAALGRRHSFSDNRPFSIEIWFRADRPDSSVRRLVANGTPDSSEAGRNFQLYYAADYIQFHRRGSPSTYASAPPPRQGIWHHIVVTYASGPCAIYVDGIKAQETNDDSGSRADPPDTELVVGDEAPEWFNKARGDVDELAIYDKVLSAERVKAHYDAAIRP